MTVIWMQSCFMFQNYFIYLFWRGTGWTKLRIALKGVWLLNVKLAGPSNVWKHVGQIQKQMLCDAVNSPKKLKSACHLGITGPEAEGKGCKNWKWILKLKLCAVQKKKKKKTASQDLNGLTKDTTNCPSYHMAKDVALEEFSVSDMGL